MEDYKDLLDELGDLEPVSKGPAKQLQSRAIPEPKHKQSSSKPGEDAAGKFGHAYTHTHAYTRKQPYLAQAHISSETFASTLTSNRGFA
jgi:hypothetical protein